MLLSSCGSESMNPESEGSGDGDMEIKINHGIDYSSISQLVCFVVTESF